jgi:hypothetical protein
MILSSEQIEALREVVSNPSLIAASALDVEESETRAFIDATTQFVKKHAKQLAQRSFGFAWSGKMKGLKKVDVPYVLSAVTTKKALIIVDSEFKIVDHKGENISVAASSRRTAKNKTLEMIFQGTHYFCVGFGQVLDEGNAVNELIAPEPVIWRKPFSEFPTILDDHVEICLKSEKLTKYWHNKAKRILRSVPDGTEKIFHHSLYWWVKNFVADTLRVYGETRGMGQDATDITIVTSGGSYVIEVKWMGKNEKNNSHDRLRIDQGLQQVKLYLENDPELVGGFLVLYDGRDFKTHTDDSAYADNLRHITCQRPMIIFLESDTPSQIADQVKD